jgi:hypothetical protein
MATINLLAGLPLPNLLAIVAILALAYVCGNRPS